MNAGLVRAERLFDHLAHRWESRGTQHRVGSVLVLAFLAALLAIELNRQGLLPRELDALVTRNHFTAIAFTFSLLLVFEVVGLVFALAESVANSVGKQFELLALILLRKAFLEVGRFGEPIEWEQVAPAVLPVLGDIGGALLLFVMVGIYYRVQRHQPITGDEREQASFVAAKKAVALVMLATLLALGGTALLGGAPGGGVHGFFEVFYTVLIFTDVLIVLISLQYSTSFAVVFRNSGFAAATVVIRLALTAPSYLTALLGLAAATLAVGVSYAYNVFAPVMLPRDEGWERRRAPEVGPS